MKILVKSEIQVGLFNSAIYQQSELKDRPHELKYDIFYNSILK